MSTTATSSASAAAKPAFSPARRTTLITIGVLVLGTVGWFGYHHLKYVFAHEETDDAQVEGHISPVLPRVSGYVARVLINDNQRVTAGQPLIEVDPVELDLHIATAEAALKSAEAAVKTAEAGLINTRANAAVAHSNIATAEVTQKKTEVDRVRDSSLVKTGAITDREFDDTKAAADKAVTTLESIRREASAADTQVSVAESQIVAAHAQLAQRKADLDYAKLQRSYATVIAPIDGLVSRKNVEPGQYIQAGQTLLSITSDTEVWVVANYKETQLTEMKVGQPVEISVSTYPDVVFHGKIDSIAGATGARFALLPPDNASGNYVKVTQRVPVKIVLTDKPDAARLLRPGLSVDTAVRTQE